MQQVNALAMQLYRLVTQAYTTERNEWLVRCDNNSKFVLGGDAQWTKEELESLNNRGGYTITLDKTRKAINGMVGMLTANQPSLKCTAVNGNTYAAKVRSIMLDHVLRENKFLSFIRTLMYRGYVDNIAYAFVDHHGNNKITLSQLKYDEVIVDPSSRDNMFTDAAWIAIVKFMPIEQVKALYGLTDVSTDIPASYSTEYYSAIHVNPLFDATRQFVKVFEIYKRRLVNTDGEIKAIVEKSTLVGYNYATQEILPSTITTYPIIPIYSDVTVVNPLKVSDLELMRDTQRYANKMNNITIMNAQATGSPKTFVRLQDIPGEDLEQFNNDYSIPGAVLGLGPNAEAPVVVSSQPLNNAYFSLYRDAVQHLTQTYSGLGLDGNNTDSASHQPSLFEKREVLMDSMKITSGIYEAALSQMAIHILELVTTYMDDNTVVRLSGGVELMQQIQEDINSGLDVENPDALNSFIEKMKKENKSATVIDDMIFEATDRRKLADAIFDMLHKIDDITYDLDVAESSYAPSYAATKWNSALVLAEHNAIDPETLLELSPLDDKEKILRRISVNRQLSAQIDELTKQLEAAQETIGKMASEAEMLRRKNVDVSNQARHDAQFKAGQLANQYAKKSMQMDRAEASRKLEYMIKEFMLTLSQSDKDALAQLTYDDIKSSINLNE